ncbi:ABC transporter permease [Actinophytocola glycyrrhizae]|uniref:Transport permease protein n=1 Tax=Actinophytocola glycyrrhizae TaxID=2044873 RepID=A0ABV9S9C5_9PSEU
MTTYLTWTEVKLLAREPLVLVLTLMFPILLMVLLAAAFADHSGPVFADLDGTQFYVTAYLSAAISVMGFMGTPTHLAGYREAGVLRRFRTAAIPSRAVVFSQAAVLALLALVGAVVMLALAYALFDIAAPASPVGVAAAFAVGILAFAGIGTLLGSLMPGARSAQGLGLLLFFGTFLLVGGGPPPGVFPDALNAITSWTPTGLLINAIRSPWAGDGLNIPAMVTLVLIAAAGFALATRRLSRS